MQDIIEKVAKQGGLTVHLMPTEKYKTNTLFLLIRAPLNKETVAKRALLGHVLQNGTSSSPSRKALRERLDAMYGATLTTDVQKKGEEHVITFMMDVANERFLSDSTPLFRNALNLLAEVVTDPFLENGLFSEQIVEQEKRSLKQRIQSVYDDKMRYANVRVTEEMCKGENFALTAFGTVEEVEEISAQSLYEYYIELLQTNAFDLYLVGALDQQETLEKVKQAFELPDRQVVVGGTTESPQVKKVNIVHENQDVKQGKLHLGYRTYTTYGDADYVAVQVFNGIFGGFSHSKLFINVREKESLAYYAASRLESHKGIMMVMSGIEFNKYDRAVDIINEQLEAMRNGEFSEGELEQTKAMLKNQILETADVARGLVELHYHQVISGSNRSLPDWLTSVDQVTKEDVIEAANKVKLDTIYFLKGKEESA
ncbi:EF-P 5-aminopentanol modification-associated protein YfmF [Halalkalibacter hemicellulosilyticus]|uniref:Zinc protease n=1 Tax=Halalkalibacter hemicellulosilyticusJCM 9152 TaxID=1236971 RepID=W4QFF6_9BACI|nr:pitrilysin family protein [Halalkalibacter hemicellulosilyticus]GAE30816.1 Zinc protease [Halalkalibacter hemicellulosilyticusJCM 9152]